MIKSTILLALTLIGLTVPFSPGFTWVTEGHLGFPETMVTQKKGPEMKTITLQDTLVIADPLPKADTQNVVWAKDVVLSVPAPKSLKAVSKKEKQLLCGALQASQVGGSYRRCEWK